jgi:hypothetical protein
MSRLSVKKTASAIQIALRQFTVGEDGTSGSALIEFTIFAPVIVVAGIYSADFGLYYFHQARVQNAAQAGAQYAITKGSPPPFSSINGITINSSTDIYCPESLSTPVAPDFSCADGSKAGSYIIVTSQVTYNTLARFGRFSNATYSLTGSAMVRVQ